MKTLRFIVAFIVLAFALPSFAAMTQGVPDNGKAQFLSGNFKPTTDTLKWRLYVTANTTMSVASTTACSATGELSGGGYAAVTATSPAVTTDTTNHYAILSFANPSWSGLTAAHVDGIALCDYTSPNDTTNGTLIGYWTFTDTPVSGGTLTVTIPTAAYNTGLLTWH